MDHLTEKTLSTEEIFKGRIIDVQVDEVLLPDGKKGKREIVKHPGAVAVIALTPHDKLLLVRQFRKPLEKTIIEIPAGKLEKGEDPEESAKRELLEETGYECQTLAHVTSFYTAPGFSDELIHIYYTDTLKEAVEQQTDDDEFVEVIEVSLDKALKYVADGQICDAKTVFAVQYLQLKKEMRKNA
ncbi:NUDIX hydrolase [Fictibacillus sp. Mic-4]|uniref:NUDIX domain-containing protein n=1 Tax=Fictibacillus sp. Mic-4 TaxID=3132826 RepID=UPI003CF7BEF2